MEKAGLIRRDRLESNERKLLLTLTEQGEALQEKARAVPAAMQGCIPLSEQELFLLKTLLNRALAGMETKEKTER